MKKAYLVMSALFLLTSAKAFAAQNEISAEALAAAKMAGACQVMDALIVHQSDKLYKDGNKLVVSFWTAEAKKLNMSPADLYEHCDASIKIYNQLEKSITAEKPTENDTEMELLQ